MGTFRNLREFNETIYDNGYSDSFEAEDYKYFDLQNSCADKVENPISRWANYWQQIVRLRSLNQLFTLSDCSSFPHFNLPTRRQRICDLQAQLEASVLEQNDDRNVADSIEKFMDEELCMLCLQNTENPKFASDAVIVNPSQFKKLVAVRADSDSLQGIIRLEPFEISAANAKDSFVNPSDPPLLLEQPGEHPPILRNDFFEIRFDVNTGGIQSVNRHTRKGNLFSQRLAARISETVMERGYPRQRSRYADLVCQNWSHQCISNLWASVESKGVLMDQDQPIANFVQTVSVRRGDSNVYFDVEFSDFGKLQGFPWRNYVASRIAWANEGAKIIRSENEISDHVYQEKITAPNFVEISDEQSKISLLPGGLPFHRRSHRRMLDTLLLVENENCRKFKFAVAVDPAVSMNAATDYLTPVFICDSNANSSPQGWIFHLNCQNILLTHLESNLDASGKLTGITLRLQETEGRSGELKIACPFDVEQATRTNLLGEVLFELGSEQEVVNCSFLAFQYIQLEIRKKQKR